MKNLLSFSVELGINNGYGVEGSTIVEVSSSGKVMALSTYFTGNNGVELGHAEDQLLSELTFEQRIKLSEAVEIFMQGVANSA